MNLWGEIIVRSIFEIADEPYKRLNSQRSFQALSLIQQAVSLFASKPNSQSEQHEKIKLPNTINLSTNSLMVELYPHHLQTKLFLDH
jgi:hypothetical protein